MHARRQRQVKRSDSFWHRWGRCLGLFACFFMNGAPSSSVFPRDPLLTESIGTITISGATLTGADQQVTYTIPITVSDLTGLRLGWNLQMTSTQFNSGGGAAHTLSTSASVIQSVSFACNGVCTLPNNSIIYPVTLPAGATPPAAVKIANAAALSGMGSSTLTASVQLALPANSYAGTYSSTLTVTIAAGP